VNLLRVSLDVQTSLALFGRIFALWVPDTRLTAVTCGFTPAWLTA
jgi:hypothetical protein